VENNYVCKVVNKYKTLQFSGHNNTLKQKRGNVKGFPQQKKY